MKVTDFIGTVAEYDNYGPQIWGKCEDGELQHIADVRGWGAIQNLFRSSDGSIDMAKAAEFQDELGEWIADAINEKLERDRNVDDY